MGADNQPMTKDSFLKKAREQHGNRYLYDNFHFTDRKSKSFITCRIHGDFEMTPKNHVRGQGCKLCGKVKYSRAKKISSQEWLERFESVHGDRYTYTLPLSGRLYAHDYVTVNCKKHGSYQAKAYAIGQGRGCLKCGNERGSEGRTMTTSQFIERAREVHGDRYLYDCTQYQRNSKRIKVRCRVHGVFECLPTEHWAGSNCMTCSRLTQKRKAVARGSWLNEKYFKRNPEMKGIPYRLYLLRMNDSGGCFLKIGITTNIFKPKQDRIKFLRRLCYDRDKFEKLVVLESSYYDCWKNEQSMLEKYKDFKYVPIDEFGGHSECLSLECLPQILEDFKQMKETHNG